MPMNLYLTEQPTSQPFGFGKIGEVQGETVVSARRERGRKEGSTDLVQLSGDSVYLASDDQNISLLSKIVTEAHANLKKRKLPYLFD